MPELIEVQRAVEDLRRTWVGRELISIDSIGTRAIPYTSFFGPYKEDFRKYILGNKVLEVTRHAKHIQIYFESRWSLWIHFSSTGWLIQTKAAGALKQRDYTFLHSIAEPSHRFTLGLSDGQRWTYSDSRTWGKFIVKKGRGRLDSLSKYGPDWLDDPEGASIALHVHRGNRTIKAILCDQTVASGVGNYLACEACFEARVHPHSRWATLSPEDVQRLADSVLKVIKDAQDHQGHEHWKVFKREHKPCVNAGALNWMSHVVQYAKDPGGQRGSYFCPVCQGSAPSFELRKLPSSITDPVLV